MIRAVVLAVGAGAVTLAVATGRVDDIRSQIGLKENPFNAINQALKEPSPEATRQKIAWGGLTRNANRICADSSDDALVVRRALPSDPAEYARAIKIALRSERRTQAALAKLQPPAGYRLAYSKFLQDREITLAQLERLLRAAKKENAQEFALAARGVVRARVAVNRYAQSARMPACAL